MGMNAIILYIVIISSATASLGFAADLNSAAKEILSAPDWTRTEAVEIANKRIDEKRGKKIIDVMEKYAALSPEEARSLVSNLSDSGKPYDLSIGGKIYIFNRVYCNVPEKVKKVDWKFFGGWGSVPQDKETVNSLYPLRKTKTGRLELFYLSGSYTGPPYRGLEEFDFLLKRFGKRNVINRQQ
jgi:polyhydroxyalkanoate synthesis regulator phasin